MILLPFCFMRNQRLAQHELLKKYVFNKICVKEIISKSNELEKLKLYMLEYNLRCKYDKVDNCLPGENVKSIWDSKEQEEYLRNIVVK